MVCMDGICHYGFIAQASLKAILGQSLPGVLIYLLLRPQVRVCGVVFSELYIVLFSR